VEIREGMLLASDIEAIGFYDKVNTKSDVHCLCSIDIETNEVYLFHDHPEFDNTKVVDPYDGKEYTIPVRTGSLDDGILFWEKVSSSRGKLIIHNARTYDEPVINKVWQGNTIAYNTYHDTFIQSKLQWFERRCPKGAKSPHGLKAYGIKFGVNKPEVEDWSFIDAFKLHRCIEDCKIQSETYKFLEKERLYLKDKYNIDFSQALNIENLYATECFRQEIYGAMLDIPFARSCVEELDKLIADLVNEIEPQLPPTIKGKGAKLSRKEIATKLGLNPDRQKEVIIQRKKNGEVVDVIEKPYFSPCTKWTNVVKGNVYYGFNLSYGDSPKFTKKKELTDWIKANYPDTKSKDWDIQKEEVNTEVLSKDISQFFEVEDTFLDLIGGPFTKIEISPSRMTQSEVVKGFLIKLGLKDFEDWNLATDINDEYIKAEKDTWVYWPPKAHKDNQTKRLVKKGELMVSSPKLSDSDYDQLPEGLGKKIADYNTYNHRRRFLENPKDQEGKGLLAYVNSEGRIPCGVNNFATRSGRGAQRVWVNAPSDSALYGDKIRRCIIAPEGKSLVGIDMKSAQLSIAAYYANNYDYYQNVASGLEFDTEGNYVGQTAHCVNSRMFGMVSNEDWQKAVATQDKDLIHHISLQRKKSKGGSFAVIFGASGAKVAKTIGIPEAEGTKRKDQFLKQMGLDNVISTLKSYESKYKYGGGWLLPLAFGYYLWNDSGHKNPNTIIQGFEALAQKMAVIRLRKEVERNNLEKHINKICDTHDEVLLEVTEGYEEVAGKMAGEAYTWAAQQIFSYHKKNPVDFANSNPPLFAIDLNGGYKVGKDYYSVH
jgi:hypothetical protein